MDITSIASKIGESLVEPIGRQFRYLISYQDSIGELADETEKLKDERDGIQGLIDAATRKSETILPEIMRWVSEADGIMNESERFLKEDAKANTVCLGGWCPNLKQQYSLGKKAKKSMKVVSKLQQEGKFATISYYEPPAAVHLLPSSMVDFSSRTKILKQVMESLRDENMHIIAICGMGGIGKTTMAKEVGGRAKEEKLVSEVVMAVASQTPNVLKIQGEIADSLGLTFHSESATGRADELYKRINDSNGRILIIMDDIWDEFDLRAVGIPYGSQHPAGCIILLTSRSEIACSQMKSQKIFTIEVLSKDEAWNLFEEVAGTSINTPDLRPIVEKIAYECKGLPVAIVTIGRALEHRGKHEWNEALLQLQQSISKNMPGMDENVYRSIELSYNFLRSTEAKSCFLLCCLFPEDYDIDIETLVRYGKGLRLFQGVDTMEKARSRVLALVQTLKRCFLLMDSDKNECVKLHDVVRDVAVSIASRKENGCFAVRCNDEMEEWPEIDTWEDCTAISVASSKIKKHPDGSACPKLELFRFQQTTKLDMSSCQTFNESFFQGKNELKVVDLTSMNLPLPSSLQVLQNIRTLHLERCTLGDISAVGVLGMLEILSLVESQFNDLSREIGNLQHLKLLDTRGCIIKESPTIDIAGLTRLEELYLGEIHTEIGYPYGHLHTLDTSVLAGLIPLSDHLKVLDVHIENIFYLPQNLLLKKQTRFRISVCRRINRSQVDFLDNILCYQGSVDDIIKTGIHPFLKESEILELFFVCNLKNIHTQLQFDASRLKVLRIEDCNDMEYLIDVTSACILEAALVFPVLESLILRNLNNFRCLVVHNPAQSLELFCNLKIVDLAGCGKMNYVFTTSLAKGFPKLQSLIVSSCFLMEEIVSTANDDNTADDTIIFPELKYLKLHFIPKLISLCRGMQDNKVEHGLPSRNNIDTTPKVSINEEINASQREKNSTSHDEESTPRVLVSSKCMKRLIPSVEVMDVSCCDSIGVVFDFQGEVVVDDDVDQNKAKAVLSITQQPGNHGVHQRCLGCLPLPFAGGKAKNHTDDHGNTLQKPQEIKQVSPRNTHETGFQNLEELIVHSCVSLVVIFNYGDRLSRAAPSLNKLRKLKLSRLPDLMHIWSYKAAGTLLLSSSFQNLRVLDVSYCWKLKYILSASIAKLLVMLEEIYLEECDMVEVVVAKEKEEEEEEENKRSVGCDQQQQQQLVISFPQLRSISLRTMKRLSCFSSEPYAFQFPSLEELKMKKCPKFETFVRETSTAKMTTKLKQVKDYDLPPSDKKNWLGDLNTTIHHNFGIKEKLRRERLSHPAQFSSSDETESSSDF